MMREPIELVSNKLILWLENLISMLPNIVAALLILLVFWLLAKGTGKVMIRGMDRFIDNVSIIHLSATVFRVLVLVIGMFIALEVLQLEKTVTSILAGAGIIGLVIGFALQSTAANFMAGTLISIRRPFVVGNLIETNDHFGTVDEINLRNTVLKTPEGQIVIIPNKDVFESPLINYSRTGRRRVDIPVGVSYGDDLAKAKRVALEAVAEVEGRYRDEEPELYYEEFGSSSINFVVRFWIPFARQSEYLAARSSAIERIKRAFDDNGVTIPFPIRTLDFGIRGGERLGETLASWRGPEQDGGEGETA